MSHLLPRAFHDRDAHQPLFVKEEHSELSFWFICSVLRSCGTGKNSFQEGLGSAWTMILIFGCCWGCDAIFMCVESQTNIYKIVQKAVFSLTLDERTMRDIVVGRVTSFSYVLLESKDESSQFLWNFCIAPKARLNSKVVGGKKVYDLPALAEQEQHTQPSDLSPIEACSVWLRASSGRRWS